MNNNWLIVGLGNPEIKYEKNRHNIGSWLIDYAYNNIDSEKIKNKYSSLFKTQINNNVVYFAKTFFAAFSISYSFQFILLGAIIIDANFDRIQYPD